MFVRIGSKFPHCVDGHFGSKKHRIQSDRERSSFWSQTWCEKRTVHTTNSVTCCFLIGLWAESATLNGCQFAFLLRGFFSFFEWSMPRMDNWKGANLLFKRKLIQKHWGSKISLIYCSLIYFSSCFRLIFEHFYRSLFFFSLITTHRSLFACSNCVQLNSNWMYTTWLQIRSSRPIILSQ